MMTAMATTTTTINPNQVCFLSGSGSVICLPKSSFCNGRVDLAEEVQSCSVYLNGTWHPTGRRYAFVDELFCPEQNGVPGMVGAIRGLKWTTMAICLAAMAVIALHTHTHTRAT